MNSQKNIHNLKKFNHFIWRLGDCILMFPMIKKLSQKYNVDILIEDKFIEITIDFAKKCKLY